MKLRVISAESEAYPPRSSLPPPNPYPSTLQSAQRTQPHLQPNSFQCSHCMHLQVRLKGSSNAAIRYLNKCDALPVQNALQTRHLQRLNVDFANTITVRYTANQNLAAMTNTEGTANQNLTTMNNAKDTANGNLVIVTKQRDDAQRNLKSMAEKYNAVIIQKR